ncbi:ArsJ-associated glyceraldehyde-3-phosphate dehydrogenase [Paremcibacter congregatus]|uniref:Glyceraldehyde-3-phosphate dehydrogenase n=1 Tax=Paremcibacter congregatus TaxID=2043170 RepID=A0A2G4YMG1_9PROT|nr:ArsJ-associated glyceraldehyde-3-phosphate dehydrogenase [Paremcibacter congregatus]PHZ83487.1 type I glyceraldehyde-3-phosphate dehydrogenase [Paremcibacter congregatus]QDE28046.1 ArsJ-associated glyceraldehyde-3-phosphate dehydrogenase [Paremcibacter congregatus]
MTLKVAINGFGRMGRLVLRAAYDLPELEFVLINERDGTAETAAHLLEFDSVHGRWDRDISPDETGLSIGNHYIPVSHSATLEDLDLTGVDLVLECTGAFRTMDQLSAYLDKGVAKVIVAAPVKDGALNIVMGINDHLYDSTSHHIVTNASCTTNCLAPVVKVIQEKLGIRHGVITTIHDVTNTQVMVDAPHKDLRRARSGLTSLIPTSTGSATAITLIYPELQGKLNGLAVRVPLLNGSLTDCVFEVERPTSVDEVNNLLREASETYLKDILGYETRPLVSVDYTNDPRSSIIDALSTMVVDETQVKLLAWYDNEWGYVCRMAELAQKISRSL